MTAYYNEIDPYAAQWLRNLIEAELIAPGIVDERSIEDVTPNDLHGFTQCHFFAGIGVWSLALRRAGWSDDREVWTGSCPCQPFSAAGKGAGFADERHLWPSFHHLIEQRRPTAVLGEQVASADGLSWLDLVQADLEGSGYASAAADLCAAGVGAPHIRQRLYWVAYAHDAGLEGWNGMQKCADKLITGASGLDGGMGDAEGERRGEARELGTESAKRTADAGAASRPGPTNGYWADVDWLSCRDGKWRPVEPGTFPLAHGTPARVGRLRAYGNAINAQCAETFILAVMGV